MYNFWLVGSLWEECLISFSNWQNKPAYGCNLYSSYKDSIICKFNLNWSLNDLKRLKFSQTNGGFIWLAVQFWMCRGSPKIKEPAELPLQLQEPWDLHCGGTSSSFSWPFSSATASLLLWVTHLVVMDKVSLCEYQDFQPQPWNSGMQLS